MKVTARAVRSDGWWAIEVPEVEGVFSQARRLDGVAAMARDAVALMLDVDPATIEVEVQVETDHDAEVAAALEAKAAAETAQADASAKMRQAITALLADDLTVRDVGAVLQVSAARVSQLSSSGKWESASGGRQISTHGTQAEAAAAAKRMVADRGGSQVVVHAKGGRFADTKPVGDRRAKK